MTIVRCGYCHAPFLDRIATIGDDLERCVRLVSKTFGLEPKQVLDGEQRLRSALARYVLFFLLRRRWATSEISRATKFHHTTIIDGVAIVKNKMESDAIFAATMAEIEAALPVPPRIESDTEQQRTGT